MNQQELQDILDYSLVTGKFYWKIKPCKRVQVGEVAGFCKSGYCQIRYQGKLYYGHRLAFLYLEGHVPDEIDHGDQNKGNNAWLNLMSVTRTANSKNVGRTRNNTSGITGVCWDKKKQMWMASIMIAGKTKFLGYSKSLEEAGKFRQEANILYGFHPNHGK